MAPSRCVVKDCDNKTDLQKGISLHSSPTVKSSRSTRARWISFVRTKRANFYPDTTEFGVCSIHFEASCFTKAFYAPGERRRLLPGSYPTIWKTIEPAQVPDSRTERRRRKIVSEFVEAHKTKKRKQQEEETTPETSGANVEISTDFETVPVPSETSVASSVQHLDSPEIQSDDLSNDLTEINIDNIQSVTVIVPALEDEELKPIEIQQERLEKGRQMVDKQTETEVVQTDKETETVKLTTREQQVQVYSSTPPCKKCIDLRSENKNLKAKVTRLKENVLHLKQRLDSHQCPGVEPRKEMLSIAVQTDAYVDAEGCPDTGRVDDSDYEEEEEECLEDDKTSDDAEWTPEQEQCYEQLGEDDDNQQTNPRLEWKGKNIKDEPKGIVFLTRLLLLFQHCHLCFQSSPDLEVSQTGTLITIASKCQGCKGDFVWKSQPYFLGKFPAGNLLLSFAILCAGASINKVLLVLRHMGILIYHHPTYYYHQRQLLIPSIVTYWNKYQRKLLDSVRGKEVVLAGDGRHDSMGHSAKYGTYTIFCCTIGFILHIVLLQSNQVGSSSAMEFAGHQKAFTFLLATGMIITTFISDRHGQIGKWMRVDCPLLCKRLGKPVIDHFFDLWHIAKKVKKVLTKLGKEKDCEVIRRWKNSCVRHLYWSVTSTTPKMGIIILAKFQAFLSHVLNKHTDLPSPLFNKCAHAAITTPRAWLTKGSEAYRSLCDAMTNKTLLKGIKQASPLDQTSFLEGYHSVINQFAPKMYAYSYHGMLCRTILAALHFNLNLHREDKLDNKGQKKLNVTYPKYKEGEASVREVKVPQSYDYVDDIFETLTTTSREDLNRVRSELKAEVPQPLHSSLDKQSKEEAVEKHRARKKKTTTICPPTCSEAELQTLTQPQTVNQGRRRKAPRCRTCGKPLKGHKKGQCNT